MSAHRQTRAPACAVALVPQLLALATPRPLVPLSARRRHSRHHHVVAATRKVVRTTARADAVRGARGVGQTVALVAPLPARLGVRRGREAHCQRVVAAAGADVFAAGRARRPAVVAQQLVVFAPAPAVLRDGSLRAQIAVHADGVFAVAGEVVVAVSLAGGRRLGKTLALAAPAPRLLPAARGGEMVVAVGGVVVLAAGLAGAQGVAGVGEDLTLLAPFPAQQRHSISCSGYRKQLGSMPVVSGATESFQKPYTAWYKRRCRSRRSYHGLARGLEGVGLKGDQ